MGLYGKSGLETNSVELFQSQFVFVDSALGGAAYGNSAPAAQLEPEDRANSLAGIDSHANNLLPAHDNTSIASFDFSIKALSDANKIAVFEDYSNLFDEQLKKIQEGVRDLHAREEEQTKTMQEKRESGKSVLDDDDDMQEIEDCSEAAELYEDGEDFGFSM